MASLRLLVELLWLWLLLRVLCEVLRADRPTTTILDMLGLHGTRDQIARTGLGLRQVALCVRIRRGWESWLAVGVPSRW